MNGPIAIAANGTSIQTATGPQSLLALGKPLTKLDTTNIVSFQTLSILFNNEPPQPTPGTLVTDTLLDSSAHGYSYIPAVWMSWQNPSPAFPANPSSGNTATTFPAFGDDTAAGDIPSIGTTTGLSLLAIVAYNDPVNGLANYSSAFLYVIVDAANISIYVRKQAGLLTSGGAAVPVYLAGTTVNMRIYAFTEPATTSTY